jgi:hypothetical protein
MPGGDRTGPLGQGPMTGRGAGFCRGYDEPGFASRWSGRRGSAGRWGGFGGGGFGRGRRNQYYATGLPGWARGRGRYWTEGYSYGAREWGQNYEVEETDLRERIRWLNAELDEINRRMSDLQAEKDKK